MKKFQINLNFEQARVIERAISRFDEIGRGDIYHAFHDIAMSWFKKFNSNKECIRSAELNFDKLSTKINENYSRHFQFKKDYLNKLNSLEYTVSKVIDDNYNCNDIEIVLNEDQFDLLSFICNFVCRIYFGDLKDTADTIASCYVQGQNKDPYSDSFNDYMNERDRIQEYTDFIEMYYYNLHNGNWGVCQDDNFGYEGTFLFDCHQVLRHQIFLNNSNSKTEKQYFGVDAYPAMKHTPSNINIGKKLIEVKEYKNDKRKSSR